MADRWSNPSGSVGFDRFRVWPLGSDSYAHADLANNWDTLDGILGNSPSANWPPTTGLNGGIYGVIQALSAQITTLQSHQPIEFGLFAARPSVGSSTTGTVYVATDTGGVFQMTGAAWILIAQEAVPMTVAAFGALASPYDGQMVDLVDSFPNSTYRWRFVYNASRSDAYKWEFIGGSPTFSDGFTVTLPRGGNYTITWAISFFNGGNGGSANAAASSGSLSGATSLGVSAGTTAGGTGFANANVAGTMQLLNCSPGCVVSYSWNTSANPFTHSSSSASAAAWSVFPVRIN